MTYFSKALPIDKHKFISIYENIMICCQLLIIPFGISDEYRDIDEYHNDYVLIYKQMEESLSKQIYQLLDISVESIAASVHQYIDIDHDDEMIEMIHKSQEIMKTIIKLSHVVDLTPINKSYNLDSPSIIAEVLNNVLKVMTIILSKESFDEKFDYIDEYYKNIFNIDIARRIISPSQRCGDLLSLDIYKMLLDSLTIKVNDNIIVLSTIQYYTLLELYKDSNEVQQVLLRYKQSKDKIVLNDIRDGNWNMIYTVQPTIACCIQLNNIIDQEIENSSLAKIALKRIISMEESKIEVKRALSMDDKEEALTILDKALSTDMEEEESYNESDNQDIMLPIHMRVELLTCRADIHSKMNSFEEGLADCDEAIELDKYNSTAYAIRAEIYGQFGDLQSAAQDALAAFLYGGSADLSLAAAAEDAARACCRLEAKDIYSQRREKGEYCPKDWMVCSYLTGYEPLSSALAVDPELNDSYDKNFFEHQGTTNQTNYNNDKEVYDIDFDVDRLDLGNLIQPPIYMIDTDDNGSIIEKPKDSEAYWLLRRLIALLDTAQFKENVLNNESTNGNSNTIKENDTDDNIKTFCNDDDFLDFINNSLSTENVIDFGICESNGNIVNNNDNKKEIEIDFSNVVVEPSKEYIQALQLLKSARASVLTGVLFYSGGGIESVLPSSRDDSNDDDDDDNWEDCDDDDDDDDDDNNNNNDDDNKDINEEKWNSPISCKIRARLLNICGVIAYLSGDATGSVQCLRVSMKDDPTLLDTQLKLGSILIDMDERDEATKLLMKTMEKDLHNPIVYLHLAELEIHNNDFHSAVTYLWKAQNYCESFQLTSPLHVSWYVHNSNQMVSDIALNKLGANITALLGVALFRKTPNSPENSIMELRRGIEKYPNALYVQLCLGEVLSQLGDAVGALELFKKAAIREPSNPVPFINAARTYQQMNQRGNAARHLNLALHTDPSLAMTKVDCAQNLIHSGKTEDALAMLDEALLLAKHVSEICDVLTAKKIATIQLQLQEESKHLKLFQYMDDEKYIT